MTTNEEEIKKSARLRKIMQVMRKYHFVSNFYHQTNPQAICQALQELGPTFIKLGQILSTRPDLVSPAYIKELRHLQDQVKADSFATVEQTFEEETGKKINEEFASFAEKPFASASIGQVHHATLKDGTPVVVKVQHPEVGKLVNTDLALLRKAVVLFKYVPQDIAVVDLDKVIDELSTSLLSEVNTLEEAKNGEEFYTLNNGDGPILVPKVYMKYCAPKILVNEAMEECDGNVLVLPQFAPWKGEAIGSSYKFVVYPSSRGGYSAQGVPVSADDKTLVCPFPEEWCGKPPEELVKITGIKTLRFCHPNAFLAAADEKEDAVKAARMALDINKNGNARLT